jgi:translation initiation factor 2B subunit (eIF-2B alpha/beta/delta family)
MMMEWRDWPSWRRLNAIARLPVGGAAAAGGLAAGSMAEFIETLEEYAPEAYPVAVRHVAEDLIRRQSAIAPIVGLVNTLFLNLDEGPAAVIDLMRDMERRIATSAGLLSEVGSGLIEPGAGVLTFGASGSVRAVLTTAGRTRSVFVSCAATLPDGEGVEMAADLAAAGLGVELIPDDEIADVMLGCDLVMLGTSAVGPSAAMNIAGSAMVTREALSAGVPIYLVGSVEKVLPGPLFDRAVLAGSAEGRYEPIPLSNLTAVVTEFGVLHPEAAGLLAAELEVAPELTVP